MIYDAGLVLDSNSDETESENMQLAALTLMICQECNMKCAYYYGDGGEYNNRGKMSLETALLSRCGDYSPHPSTEPNVRLSRIRLFAKLIVPQLS